MTKQILKKYALSSLLACLSLLIVVIGFNVLVDPFRMYRLIERPGFNLYKPAIYKRVRLLKAYEVRRLKPESILLGTSRCHLAFRPSHEGWAQEAANRYNLAFDGATTKEMYYYLLHAYAAGALKQVILGLDTYHPTNAPAMTRPDFDPSLLLTERSLLSWPRMVIADLKLLTSFDTLAMSIKTLREQKNIETEWFAPDGQRLGEVFFRRPSEDFIKFGPRYYFDETDKMEVKYKLEWKIPSPLTKGPSAPMTEKPDPLTSLVYIERIVEFCRAKGIDLKIFLTPSHVHQLEITAAAGEWPSIENGKRNLLRILADDAQEHPNQPPIKLYDFSGYSSITTEPLPEKGSFKEMAYYWDSSHFKQNVGDMALDQMFDVKRKGEPLPEDFGVLVTADHLDNWLSRIEARQKEYREHNKNEVKQLVDWVEEFKREHNIKD